MYIGVLSDTHGNVVRTNQAAILFRQFDVETVLHCGDIGSASVIDCLKEFKTHYVFGNCDSFLDSFREKIEEANGVCLDFFGGIELEGKRIGLTHGHDEIRVQQEILSAQWDMICYGHTHEYAYEECRGVFLLNPGALDRTRSPSVALIQLPELRVLKVGVDGCNHSSLHQI